MRRLSVLLMALLVPSVGMSAFAVQVPAASQTNEPPHPSTPREPAHPASAQTPPTQNPSSQESAKPNPALDPPDISRIPLSLDRIRREVEREPRLRIDFTASGVPLYRISVQERVLKLEDYWKVRPDTAVSRDIRASYASNWHHEFLSMVTPKQQIAASPFGIFGNPVHPVGVPGLTIGNAIGRAWQSYELEQIRRQIQDELKQIEENQRRLVQQSPP
jgi:hypothetical protein